MKFPKLHSPEAQELAADVTAERRAAGKCPKKKGSSAQKKLIALKIKTKRLQRCAWVLEKHLSHTTRHENDYSGQARAGMTNVNMILSTPVRRADIIMRKDGLNPSRNKEVRKIIAAHGNHW